MVTRGLLCAAALSLTALAAAAQTASTSSRQGYPDRTVRMVTAEAGGSQDVAARILAVGFTRALGQQVVIDNRAIGVIPGGVIVKFTGCNKKAWTFSRPFLFSL